MRIIDTDKLNPKSEIRDPKQILNSKPKNYKHTIFGHCLLIITCSLLIGILPGYAQDNNLEQAQNAVQQSEGYYQQAVKLYQDLIVHGKNLDNLHFQLGKLYYDHGDFKQAVEEFKKTSQPQAKKFLAIAYYHLGNFIDASDAFRKNLSLDNESHYYYGLTAEELNLFDSALDSYRKIKSGEFSRQALERINSIEKQANPLAIKDISPQTYEIIASSPSEAEYPQAGALILLSDEKIEIKSDDTQVSEMHYIVKILNERGKEDFSESHIDYDTTYEKVELEYARTIKPDGTVVDVGTRHIRDVSKYLNFPLYSNAHIFIISFPEIAAGAVIDYKLKIYRNQLVNKKDFVSVYPLQTSEPIIRADFTLTLPTGKPLHIKKINDQYNNFTADLGPKIDEENNRVICRWQFKNIPQIIPEANMPPQAEINPAILISSFNSWQDIYDWWNGLCRGKILADEAIKAKVKALTADKKSAQEKAREIYNFCAKDIRYVAVEYGQAGYEPHQAGDIFKNKYGDCKDQAILLVTMLREAGLEAYPVLISTKDYYNLNADFPSMLFNHAIAAVFFGEKAVFMDPTAETCSFEDLPAGDQNRRVLVFKKNNYEIKDIPFYPAEHNLIKQVLKIKINPNETIDAAKIISSYGRYDQAQRYWLLYTPPELIGETLKEKIQNISIGATLKDYRIRNLHNLSVPVVLEYDFSGPEYLTNGGALRIMPQLASLDNTLVAKEKRKYPLEFDCLDRQEAIFEVAIPTQFVIKYIPESISEDSPWMKFSAEYMQGTDRVSLKQVIELKKDLIPQAEYAEFKAFFEKLAKRIKQRVILERKND
ncbi:MAG: DUF3857 domain-containing protein [Candidatus Omnitrophica bacterium]|jgi:hypothetical protein|nr:DUF3857 domain-containing protein [Candidatus Omnitrophota bacterium]